MASEENPGWEDTGRLGDIALELASGYPSRNTSETAAEFASVLKIVLPALAEKAGAARQRGNGSTEEVWKVIRAEAEASFQPALGRAERIKVLYVASKFMNNKRIGMMITQAALARAAGKGA